MEAAESLFDVWSRGGPGESGIPFRLFWTETTMAHIALFAGCTGRLKEPLGFLREPSTPRHHYLPNPGRGSL